MTFENPKKPNNNKTMKSNVMHNFKNNKIKFKHFDDYLQSTFSFKK